MRVTDIPEAEAFILHWGEMGTHWGVNRSVSQIHALLYLSDSPLNAEEICESEVPLYPYRRNSSLLAAMIRSRVTAIEAA